MVLKVFICYFQGGIAQGPYLESHGGSTYCAVASLFLMDRMDTLSASERSQLVRWLVNRQKQGFNGRPDKDDDTCYTFWIGIIFIFILMCTVMFDLSKSVSQLYLAIYGEK